nr:MAG TPA: hypothetical protein [Caudoviricetes sp.]
MDLGHQLQHNLVYLIKVGITTIHMVYNHNKLKKKSIVYTNFQPHNTKWL